MSEEKKPPKQVIIVRADLKMQRGKEIAQGSHASMSFIAKRLEAERYEAAGYVGPPIPGHYKLFLKPIEEEWLYNGRFTKIGLAAESREQLLALHEKALAAGLESHLITDSGLTVFHGIPTDTCIAIGPDEPEKIDAITQGLKLR